MLKTYTENGKKIEINHLEKIFYPESNISKEEIIEYYQKISPLMLPLIKDHVINMLRAPDGIKGGSFYHKDIPDYFPAWLKRVKVERKNDDFIDQVVCNDTASLIYLAGQGCLSFHYWLSKKINLHKPDRIIFDFDPPDENSFATVISAVKITKKVLDEFSLPAYLMTTGSKGLHVVIPIKNNLDFEQIKVFARNFADHIASLKPDQFTTELRKEKRQKRLFIDWLRNNYAQTAIAPYSTRLQPNASVATPLAWQELSSKTLSSQKYNIRNIFRRLESKENPWESFMTSAIDLKKHLKEIDLNFN